MKKKYVVGVDLGGTKIYTALVDLDGNIVKEVTVKTEAQKGDAVVLDKIIKTIDDVLIGTDIDEIKAITTIIAIRTPFSFPFDFSESNSITLSYAPVTLRTP